MHSFPLNQRRICVISIFYLLIYLFTYLLIYLSIYLFIYSFIHLFICFICLLDCLFCVKKEENTISKCKYMSASIPPNAFLEMPREMLKMEVILRFSCTTLIYADHGICVTIGVPPFVHSLNPPKSLEPGGEETPIWPNPGVHQKHIQIMVRVLGPPVERLE